MLDSLHRFVHDGGMLALLGVSVWVGCARQEQSSQSTSNSNMLKGAAWQWSDELIQVSSTASNRNAWKELLNDSGSKVQRKPAGSIGSNACRECHPGQYDRFQESAHGRSARDAIVTERIRHDHWTHEPSGRLYEVGGDQEEIWHRETIPGKHSKVFAVQQAKMDLELGSGTHALTCLFRDGEFLCESPVTWYRQTEDWGLSPGYDPAKIPTFSRAVTTSCVFCHVGSIDVVNDNPNQFAIREVTISCERCHGSGAAHVDFHNRGDMPNADAGRDMRTEIGVTSSDPIVHPAKLSRERSEAVCSQCHLQGEVLATAPGQDLWDFVPGELLSTNRTDFQTPHDDNTLRLVGHTEQLHASVCYQQSATLTCITCHNPHQHFEGAATIDAYRQVCVSCHQDDACGIEIQKRVSVNQNDCSKCHMPLRPTNVTHAALHDHTIGVHAESYRLAELTPPKQQERPKQKQVVSNSSFLYPLVNEASVADAEMERRLALVTHNLFFNERHLQQITADMPRAQKVLLGLHRSGNSGAAVDVALAQDYLDADLLEPARQLATAVDQSEKLFSDAKINATHILAQIAFRQQRNAVALKKFETLTHNRRVSGDHYLLAICLINAGQVDAAVASLENALRIDPTLWVAHEQLAVLFQHLDKPARSRAHRKAMVEIKSQALSIP
ncbi:cytochrome c3 family protein [Neorhodopirellula lusitana]|nr:cytochrome c3 family protein [Neorhodopirellula lusitana]